MDEFPELAVYSNLESRGWFSEYCSPEQPSSLNENYVGLSVFHENLNLSNIWYDYDCFYFGTEIGISKQLSNFLWRIWWEFFENILPAGLQIVSRHGV